ncbi:TonB-dependent receptor [Archangium lipolyticum]|uniref:TonB-dependent receptor n=1 Tax=Archangium lipolyticum TaxID=2970465 RepID=UPI00214A263C|nr:TonB-dependent receptor [Archangium lipolyticum]
MPPSPLIPWRRMLLLATALSALPAHAHDDPAPEEHSEPEWTQSLSLEELLQVELSAPSKRLQKAREAPGVASVVTREQLQRFGWTTLEDILISQPGFFASHDYERNTVGARGLWEGWNNNHLLLLVDGVPMNDNDTAAAFTWDITPLFLVKSVEILRGPASSLYGSSAIHGVIAINTLSSARTLSEGERLEINSEARLRFGSQGTAAVDAVAVTRSRHVSAVVGFQHLRTDGFSYLSYDGSGRTDATGALQRFTIRDNHESDYLFVKLEALEALEGLSLQYHLQDWSYRTGHGWNFWVPDIEEPMRDRRHIAVLRYRSAPGGTLEQEYVFKYQRHEYDNHVRFYPNGALDGRYPSGVTEVFKSAVNELFGRAQLSASLLDGHLSLLGGVEYGTTLYHGDEQHYSNADLSDEEGDYPASETRVLLRPLYAPILDEPFNKAGAYAQLAWSRMLELPLSLTLGLRYDFQFFHYRDPRQPDSPRRYKSYEQLSPRLSLVFLPSSALSLKLQAGRAFRAPSSGELFGTDTWMLDSNVEVLRPERVTTFDLGADWSIRPNLSWRNTLFHSSYDNLIGYSNENALNNLFTQTHAGLESELMAEVDLGRQGRVSAFGSYTYVRLLGGSDPDGVSPSNAGHLTWAPAHLAKAGASYRRERFSLALQGRYQSEVHRREEELLTPSYAAVRPSVVPAWFRFDANARFQLTGWATAELKVTNLLNTRSYLVKTGDFPFDYQMEGRRVFASVEIDL